MSLRSRLVKSWLRFHIWLARRKGLTIGEDYCLAGIPDFGSEPYLVTIGRHVSIAYGVTFITHDGGTWIFRDQERYKDVVKFGRIHVKDNCMLGHGAIILPGVTIGPNSLIAAGSVVTRSIPPNVVAAGNPAKPIMTVQRYAEWSLATMPEYDKDEYKRDKKNVVLRITQRGRRTPSKTLAK